MTTELTVDVEFHFDRRGRGSQKRITQGPDPTPTVEPGRVPRVARLLALAIRFERLLKDGAVANYSELASLGHVSRARVTQVMNLLLLAQDIQEELLHLPRTVRGYDPIHLWQLLPIAAVFDWRKQRPLWRQLRTSVAADSSPQNEFAPSDAIQS